jgi:predicted phosphodiesterase
MGDCEELWENTLLAVKKHQKESFEKEKQFFRQNRGVKIFGNHDLMWQNDPLAPLYLKSIYDCEVPIYEGALLQTIINNNQLNFFCTHGHQGD